MIGQIKHSTAKFDAECETFFQRCRNYRSARKGSVLVVDEKDEISDFLTFLVEHCHLKINVRHIRDVGLIGGIFEEVGDKGVKAVIIDSHLLRTSATAMWMDKNYPNVPMFISNCEPESVSAIKRKSRRAGILSSKIPLADYIDALGLPDECRDMAVTYGG